MLRFGALLAGIVVASPAFAQQVMTAGEAQRFVVGKLFTFNCFEGTRGAGRIYADGSVAGTIQFRGSGPTRWAQLPPGTIKVKSGNVCATVRGLPFEPCFNLTRTSHKSFRGSVSGLGFASCEFTRRGPVEVATAEPRAPLSLRPTLSSNAR